MRVALGIILFVLLAMSVHAATLTGTVYDLDLEEVKTAVIEIDTKPAQRMVARDGTYSFEVPPGDYILTASVREDGIIVLGSREELTVDVSGEYVYDLFLFEDFTEEDDLLDMELIDVEKDIYDEGPPAYLLFLLVFGVALVITAVLYLILRGKTEDELEGQKTPEGMDDASSQSDNQSSSSAGEDVTKDEVISIIRANGGRMTQKDLRKKLPHSEAKVSLVLAELENDGRIKKIKKGRGNILILK